MKRDVVDELDAVSILEFFGDLKDPRSAINRKHLLGDICVICICAVLAGADGPKAIGTWALSKKDWLESVLPLPNGIPSHDTMGRVLATEGKSNEITAIPELISNIEVKGAIVTIDTAGCQKNIAKQIVDAGGDYVLALKGNQGYINKDVINWVCEQFENDFADVEARRYEVAEKGHGREVTNLYIQFDAPTTLRGCEDWEGLKSIWSSPEKVDSGSVLTKG